MISAIVLCLLITEVEFPVCPTVAKAVRMGPALLSAFLHTAKRSIRGHVGLGGYMTCGWTGSAARFSARYPLLITETCFHTHFYDEFWWKTAHFWPSFLNIWTIHPCLWKVCQKRDPFLENFGPKNPPIWAAHTRILNMLCYPPPPPPGYVGLATTQN